MTSGCYEVNNHIAVPTMAPNVDFFKKKPEQITHFAIYTAAVAIGYEPRGANARAENKADWFTPEVLRAARAFLKELSVAQYANIGHTKLAKPGFLYYPSELTALPEGLGTAALSSSSWCASCCTGCSGRYSSCLGGTSPNISRSSSPGSLGW